MTPLERLLPAHADNRFRGHRVALWLFVALLALRLVTGVNSMVMTESIASGADGIPVAAFAPDAARHVLSLFALLGADRVVMAALGVVVLWRYRALVPLLYAIFVFEFLLKLTVRRLHPAGDGLTGPGLTVTAVTAGLMLSGFALSLRSKAR